MQEGDTAVVLGAHLDDMAPVETVRYLGPKSKADLNAIGIFTVGDLKQTGVIDAFLMMKRSGMRVSRNFVWAMYAGLMGIDFHQVSPEFKAAVVAQLEKAENCAGLSVSAGRDKL